MTATYIVQRVDIPGWPQAFGVTPVIAGWDNPRPRAVVRHLLGGVPLPRPTERPGGAPVKPIRHRIQTTFVVGLEHWIVVQRDPKGGWQVLEIAEHTHVDSTHQQRCDAEVVACALAVVRSFNTRKAPR